MKLSHLIYCSLVLMAFAKVTVAQNKPQSIDEVVAIVDTGLITKVELNTRIAQIEKQFKASNRPLPPANELKKQVLERLISERIQEGLARDTGIKIADKELDKIIENIAAQNKTTVENLKAKIEKEGLTFKKYREDLRKEVQISRLRERDVDARVQVSDAEIDGYIAEKNRSRASALGNEEVALAQIVISLNLGASESEVATAKAKAEEIFKQAGNEKDFLAFSKKVAAAGSGVRSEDLGSRTFDRLPQLLVEASQGVGANQLIPRVLQSGAGFHIVKVMGRKGGPVQENIVITQTMARHILLRHRAGMTDAEAERRLSIFRDQVKVKAADFGQLAQKYSEDGSAPNGGKLGWMSPGELVPTFEQAMNKLNIGEVSDPVRTEFGWHLIQVLERRQTQLSADKQREYARAALREKKLDQAYEDWIRQIRDAATVEIRQID
ncbi:peptidylprolyl isomerase [Polynucleobacter sp. MWH-Spelu-300-X4]|uniref:peptidylprolyl isomerase n=1 Tax=Polynucleobacter sp. MWH-Spelu-300-X4 TaxID=2689109 RepID=UPI001BFDE958|nr:peptidylprolyl isomerase [Polynucleobacter sp. MWH-Spelu-300-X4]QWD79592.1 peptidylprolyl isomerase [Polynucleobacter sp. MWH-Spelu-300-X4]